MARHLPPAIQFQPGSLVITGADSTEILEHLCLLAQALQNDLATIQTMLDRTRTAKYTVDRGGRGLVGQLALVSA
jgi:hypothetical protein